MKKVIISLITTFMIVPRVCAYNALKEHNYYRSELSSLAGKQHAENQKYIQYYRGASNYKVMQLRSSSSAFSPTNKKDVYVKKGVTFKVDEAKQEQRLKEAKESEQKMQLQKKSQELELSKSLSENPNSKVVSSKERSPHKPNLRGNNVLQNKGLELSKININIPVKNVGKPTTQKQLPAPEPTKIISNGKNVDAE